MMAENTEQTVVDASFLLNYLMPDELADEKVEYLLGQYRLKKQVFVAPSLLKYEIANAIRSAVNSRRMSRKVARKVWQNFIDIEIEYCNINYWEVIFLSLNCGLSFYDASYLWLAGSLKCNLASLDKRLIGKISTC